MAFDDGAQPCIDAICETGGEGVEMLAIRVDVADFEVAVACPVLLARPILSSSLTMVMSVPIAATSAMNSSV